VYSLCNISGFGSLAHLRLCYFGEKLDKFKSFENFPVPSPDAHAQTPDAHAQTSTEVSKKLNIHHAKLIHDIKP